MAQSTDLNPSKDTIYTLNGFGALSGLQRFNYSYTANEEDHDEIGSATSAATSIEPETSISFEIKDTGSLAAVLARMHYDYGTQDYTAGVTTDISTNAFSFTEVDLENLIFTAGEYKAPGTVFSEAVLFPYHFVTSISLRLNSDNVGSVSFDAQGALFKPLYKPYHTTKAYPVQYATATTADIPGGWSVSSGTHNLLGLEVNNQILDHTEISWSDADTISVDNGSTISTEDRLMVWAFPRTSTTTLPSLDYVTSIHFVKPDRISVWLQPEATAHTHNNKYLRVQSVDLTVDVSRDELKEIARNELGTSTFYQGVRYPLDITGQLRVFETDLDKWAELQGKTLNESATTGTIDTDNLLDISNWGTAKLVIEWYKYGNSNPIQRVVCSGISFVGYDSTQEVGGRKEATWNISTSQFAISGFDV